MVLLAVHIGSRSHSAGSDALVVPFNNYYLKVGHIAQQLGSNLSGTFKGPVEWCSITRAPVSESWRKERLGGVHTESCCLESSKRVLSIAFKSTK